MVFTMQRRTSVFSSVKKKLSIKIIGINYKDKRDNALKFLDKYDNPYSVILNDNNGTASIEVGAYGVPESFILNAEKKIIKKIIGPIDKKKFNEIRELIKNENQNNIIYNFFIISFF